MILRGLLQCALSGLHELVELSLVGNPFCADDALMVEHHAQLSRLIPKLEVLDGVSDTSS